MPDLRMSWEDYPGGYGTEITGAPATIDAGGIAVTVEYTDVAPSATAFALNLDSYDDPLDDLPSGSQLKLISDGGTAGDTSTTVLSFDSTDALYGDAVADLSFRIDDIDAGTFGDIDGSVGNVHDDVVTIRAYDIAGNEIPVTISAGGGMTVTGQTLDGDTQGLPTDAAQSALISIAGPVARVEIDLANNGSGEQEVLVSDLLFTTTDPLDNADPIANPDTATTEVDTLLEDIDVLGNDTDPDADPLTVTAASAPNGTVTINSDGTLDYDPAPGFTGPDTITYTISDGNGGTDTSTVTVTVTDDPNSLPDAVDDTATATSEVLLENIDVLGNDSDPDGDPLTVTAASAANGTVTINGDGTLNYTSDTDFVGEDTITYTIDDGVSGTDTASVIVTVGLDVPANNAPIATNEQILAQTGTLVEDIDILSNDTDPDGDPLTVTAATSPNGTVTINADGTLDYQSDPGFEGTDNITYTISDGRGGTDEGVVRVSVRDTVGDNEAPTPMADLAATPIDTLIEDIDVLANDTDPDGDTLTVTSATAENGTVTINPDFTIDYQPDPGFEGYDTITYVVDDGNGGTVSAPVTVTVGDPNELPIATDDIASTPTDTLLEDIDVLGNDTDPDGDPLTVTAATAPNGTVTINGDGTLDYDPDPGFVGPDIITYTIDDGNGGTDTGSVLVAVGAIPLIDAVTFPSIPVDADPLDDLDFIDPDAASELIETGDDADTILGGAGDDTINPGIDNDSVIAGTGNDLITDEQGADYVEGGEGDDTINVGIDTFSDYIGDDPNLPLTDGGITFVTDPNTDDGRDTVFGGDGNDVINTGDDADSIDGGDDDDTINAGIDDDTVRGGLGDDSILGGHGSDTISGGGGDDFIDSGHTGTLGYIGDVEDAFELPGLELNDRDVVTGGAGNDTILTGDDDDSVIGGQGDDFIDGGIDEDTILGSSGNDTVLGGLGDDSLLGEGGLDSIVGGDGSDTIDGGGDSDTITGGAGADSIFGNDGEDSIIGATAGDTIDGGEGPTDFDTLDLRGAGAAENVGGYTTIDYDAPGSEGGIVNFHDATDAITGTARFDNIENVIPCFTPGTMIATPTGERAVEDLKAGDRVITRDNGIQEIRWCGAKDLSGSELAANDHLQPILIQAGALGDNLPERDILVSPQHRMLLTTDQANMYFEEREVLVAAKHLTIMDGVDCVESSGTTYIHIMFDQHEVVLSNGAWSESFQPGDYTLDGIGKEQRDEILELFPELATQQGSEAYQAARRTLKKYEAALLLG